MNSIQKSALIVYFSLLLICVSLMICAEFLGPTVRSSILSVATEGFKIVLAALVGAVSVVLGGGKATTQ
jgi:threonine/homoserine efflux transporter RhtA